MNAAALNGSEDNTHLPSLREDLKIETGSCFLNGAPSWLIHDPLRNQFFRVGKATFEVLSVWQETTVSSFCKLASLKLERTIEKEEVEDATKFLYANQLTQEPTGGDYRSFAEQERAKQKGLGSLIIHNYLFFRIPLLNPQAILDVCWPLVRFLFSRGAVAAFAIMAILSLYLVSRQWEVFTSTFLSFLSFEGAVFYGISLVCLKFLHEFGHAFMAKKYNVPVPIIGLAFLVLFPVLYTDTTAAVRLKQRNQRLMIDVAGILTELVIAVIATLFWVFLPDGPMRSIAFATATLSWILSLTVNLNPFMRFDGYYILSDALGVENLQARGFAFAKWRMREILFKPNIEPPEVLSSNLRRLLVYHAWGTWIYRFFLFLGIAILVYSFFIKIVGILLFVIEILWFILLPIWCELKNWWSLKTEYKTFRSLISCLIIFTFLLAFFIPWSSRVDAPAVLKSSNEFHIYPPIDGRLTSSNLEERKHVRKGEVLFELASPGLEAELRISKKRKQLLETRLSRSAASELELSSVMILRQELATEAQRFNGLQAKQEALVVQAPFEGLLMNVDNEVREGNWVSRKHSVSILIDQHSIKLLGYVKASDVGRIKISQLGYFISDGFLKKSIPVEVKAISNISEVQLNDALLSELEGGLIAATKDSDGSIIPRGTWFKIELLIDKNFDDQPIQNITRGLAVIEAEPQSFASRVFNQIALVLIRESGF